MNINKFEIKLFINCILVYFFFSNTHYRVLPYIKSPQGGAIFPDMLITKGLSLLIHIL